jgi:hypothetical protein
MSTPLMGTDSAAGAIKRVKYTHDALIDMIIANPAISQGELAKAFGYTQGWLSRVMNSDAFQARLAARKTEVVDPQLVLSIDEKLRALASKSLDVVLDKLVAAQNTDTALKALEITSKALGYGARQQNLNVQQNFVVALPPKAASASEWAAAHGEGRGAVIDMPGAALAVPSGV